METRYLVPIYKSIIRPEDTIFNVRMVDKIKGINTKPFEKSHLVAGIYNNPDKVNIVTALPTIQRQSQYILGALAPTLIFIYNHLR